MDAINSYFAELEQMVEAISLAQLQTVLRLHMMLTHIITRHMRAVVHKRVAAHKVEAYATVGKEIIA